MEFHGDKFCVYPTLEILVNKINNFDELEQVKLESMRLITMGYYNNERAANNSRVSKVIADRYLALASETNTPESMTRAIKDMFLFPDNYIPSTTRSPGDTYIPIDSTEWNRWYGPPIRGEYKRFSLIQDAAQNIILKKLRPYFEELSSNDAAIVLASCKLSELDQQILARRIDNEADARLAFSGNPLSLKPAQTLVSKYFKSSKSAAELLANAQPPKELHQMLANRIETKKDADTAFVGKYEIEWGAQRILGKLFKGDSNASADLLEKGNITDDQTIGALLMNIEGEEDALRVSHIPWNTRVRSHLEGQILTSKGALQILKAKRSMIDYSVAPRFAKKISASDASEAMLIPDLTSETYTILAQKVPKKDARKVYDAIQNFGHGYDRAKAILMKKALGED